MSGEEYLQSMSEEVETGEETEVEEEVTEVKKTGWVKCPICGEVVRSRGAPAHWRNLHQDKGRYETWKERFVPVQPPVTGVSVGKPEAESVYKTEPDANSILNEILRRHPDIPDRVADEVMSWAEFGPIHPTQLVALLTSMKGISQQTAYIVAQKYALALQKAQSEGRLQLPPFFSYMPQTPQPFPLFQTPTPMAQGPPTTSPQPQIQIQPPVTSIHPPSLQSQMPQTPWPYLTQQPQQLQPQQLTEDRVKMILREELDRILRERLPQPEKREEYVDIEEPVKDPEGKIIVGPDDKPIVRRMRVPISHVDRFMSREDVEEKVLRRIQLYKEIFGEERITEDKIRQIIREETSKPVAAVGEEKISKEDIVRLVSDTAENILKQYMQIHEREEKEEKRHEELKKTIEDGLKSLSSALSAKSVEGYQDDAIRLLAQGLAEIGSVIRERKPVEIILKEAPKLLMPAQPSIPEVKEKVGESEVFKMLPKELIEG
ncbi:MAG: hypothetical protein QXX56_05400 [Candidatus Bathyarchaeia archaeon]